MTNLNTAIIKYVGKNVGFIPGVPARDMSNDEARDYDISALLRSGLYKLERPKRTYIKQEAAQEAEQKEGE